MTHPFHVSHGYNPSKPSEASGRWGFAGRTSSSTAKASFRYAPTSMAPKRRLGPVAKHAVWGASFFLEGFSAKQSMVGCSSFFWRAPLENHLSPCQLEQRRRVCLGHRKQWEILNGFSMVAFGQGNPTSPAGDFGGTSMTLWRKDSCG